jgi:hypothetical protein
MQCSEPDMLCYAPRAERSEARTQWGAIRQLAESEFKKYFSSFNEKKSLKILNLFLHFRRRQRGIKGVNAWAQNTF